MRAVRAWTVAAVLVLSMAMTGTGAAASGEWKLTPGGWVSGPVEYVKTVEFPETAGAGLTRHGRYLYVTTFRSFSIYDVRDALNPQLVTHKPLGVTLFNEQPDTNGKILLLTTDMPQQALDIWDVRDKANPVRLKLFPLPKPDHMWTCVLDCTYAYGGRGTIVSLADPANPKIVGDWADDLGLVQSGRDAEGKRVRFHAIEEVAPGLVLTGHYPRSFYLDGRSDPAKPKALASFEVPDLQYPQFGVPLFPAPAAPAFLDWPENATHRFLLLAMESPFSSDCSPHSGGFSTWDTNGWLGGRELRQVDSYKMSTPRGLPTEGRSPHHVVGCSAYNFSIAEDYAESGRVAVSWFEDGVRLLHVDGKGSITERGGFLPIGGSGVAPLWRNDDVIYSVDLNRGIDILRVGSTG